MSPLSRFISRAGGRSAAALDTLSRGECRTRRRLDLAALLAVSLTSLSLASAQPIQPAPPGDAPGAQNEPISGEITPALNSAVSRGLARLASQQQPDGAWVSDRYGRNAAITALACLAFLADGHMPGRGAYGHVVEKGLDFLLANVNETGLIAADTSHGPMYGHGFATLFLGEIYGMLPAGLDSARAQRLHEALVKAIRLIVQTQNPEGGWRYNPVPFDADVSVTICEVMALRSARNAGIDVPKATIDRAVEYVRKCQNPDGGFRYQLTSSGSAWPRTAGGVASLFYAGIYSDNAIEQGLDYLFRSAMPGRRRALGAHYFYGHYYAVQCMYLAGGERWERWWPAIRDELIDTQRPDGSWDDNQAGEPYGTAMALIILQMPKRYLPIFQK